MNDKYYVAPFIPLLFLLALWSCAQTSKENNSVTVGNLTDYPFFRIDINLPKVPYESANLSEIAHRVEYVTFSSPKNAQLGHIFDALFADTLVFIWHNGSRQIASYTLDGVFIRSFGKIGRGPGEYSLAAAISANLAERHIYIQSNWDRTIHTYDFEGKYVASKKNKASNGESLAWHRDSLFVQFAEPVIGDEEYVFIEKTLDGDTIQGVPNYFTWGKEKSSRVIYSFFKRKAFYRFKEKLNLKGWYNDTIYTFNDENRIVPKFFIDLNSLKLPDEYRYEIKSNPKGRKGKYWLNVNESNRFVFIGIKPYTEGCSCYYTYYDKLQQELKPILRGEMFRNNLDEGPDFYPEYITDSIAYSFIEPSSADEGYKLMIVHLK